MADTTLIFALEGEVTLEQFAEAIQHFYNLLARLTQEVAADVKIEWDLEDLQYGSAVIAVTGRAETDEPVLKVVSAFEEIGQALQHFEPVRFSRQVAKEAEALTRLIDQNITSVRLSTARTEAIIYGAFNPKRLRTPQPMIALGTVKGRVQAISNRGKLRFTLYDALFDQPTHCFVREDQQTLLTDIWDKLVIVTGRVTRQPDSGQPVSVREITSCLSG